MATKNALAEHSLRRVYLNNTVIVVVALAMVSLLFHFNSAEPNINARIFTQYSKQMQSSVTFAHWQWQAEGRPETIMMVHYDSQGKTQKRYPIQMSHQGVPKVEASREGCSKLWKMLLNIPMQANGFRVTGNYFSDELNGGEPYNARCRFRLGQGRYIDYHLDRGEVSLNATQ